MTYQIIKATSITLLEYNINAMITEGWEPHGTIFTVGIITQTYHQAMVKKERPQPGPTEFKSRSKN